MLIATAPGKLILAGEYAVLDGAPALVMAVDRRVAARRDAAARRAAEAAGAGSPFLGAVAAEPAARRGPGDPAALAALEIAADSTALGDGGQKLGLGSSAAVTVAAAARALVEAGPLERAEVLAVALAAHAAAQGPRGARGSGADVAAAVHGGLVVFARAAADPGGAAWAARGGAEPAGAAALPRVEPRRAPPGLQLAAFFTGAAADTPRLVAQVAAARDARPAEVGAALAAIAAASRAAAAALAGPAGSAGAAVIAALAAGGAALDALAAATGAPLVPPCVTAARAALAPLGAAVKTTGAGGGDLAIAAFPADVERTAVTRSLIEAGCLPVPLSLDETGVDMRQVAG